MRPESRGLTSSAVCCVSKLFKLEGPFLKNMRNMMAIFVGELGERPRVRVQQKTFTNYVCIFMN